MTQPNHRRGMPNPDRSWQEALARDGAPTAGSSTSAVSPTVAALARDLATYEARRTLAAAHYGAALETAAAHARVAMLDAAAERAVRADVALVRALGAVYRDPERAKEAFLAVAERHVGEAVQRLREHPERFGALKTTPRPVFFGLAAREDDRLARGAAREAATYGQASLDATRAVHDVTAIARARRLEADLGRQLGTVERFTASLEQLYRDPGEARYAFETLAARRGVAHAAAVMRRDPWLFAPFRDPHAPEAMYRAAADRAAALGADAVRAARELPPAEFRAARDHRWPSGFVMERGAALAAVDRTSSREAALAIQLGSSPGQAILHRQIGAALRRLTPAERHELQRIAPAAHVALAAHIGRMAREVVLGRGEPEW